MTFLGILSVTTSGVVGDLHLGDEKVTNGRSCYMGIVITQCFWIPEPEAIRMTHGMSTNKLFFNPLLM